MELKRKTASLDLSILKFFKNMSNITETIVPAKFLAIISQILIAIVVIYTREENIYAGISPDADSGDSEFTTAEGSLLTGVALIIFFLLFELAVLFMGLSLFFDAINMMRKVYVEIFIHVFGVIFLCWFILDNWTYTTIWPIWFFFA